MSGDVVYFELPGHDAEATQRFWGALFGWTFYQGNVPGYSMIDGPKPLGGTPHGDPSQHPRIFFRVDDITAATTRVRELGGTAGELVTIPAGAFASCSDDQGVAFSLRVEPSGAQPGQLVGERTGSVDRAVYRGHHVVRVGRGDKVGQHEAATVAEDTSNALEQVGLAWAVEVVHRQQGDDEVEGPLGQLVLETAKL